MSGTTKYCAELEEARHQTTRWESIHRKCPKGKAMEKLTEAKRQGVVTWGRGIGTALNYTWT